MTWDHHIILRPIGSGRWIPPIRHEKFNMIIKILKYTFPVFLAIIILGLLTLMLKSPDAIQPIKDNKDKMVPKSISEHRILELGGIEQHLSIRGVDSTKQLILTVE